MHDREAVVANPPPLPLSQQAMDRVYGLPYTRQPHPSYAEPIPAYRGGQGFGADHARLLWRLHVLLDHGARRPRSSNAAARNRCWAKSAR